MAVTPSTWTRFATLLRDDPMGHANRVPDAWLAACAIENGGRLATADRGMARWPGLDWFDPLDEIA